MTRTMTELSPLRSCSVCQYELKSTGEVGTSIGWLPGPEEDGRVHRHDPNHYSQTFRCSNGHELTIHYKKACWCEGAV
jgi:hypothetical protein